MAAVVKQRVHRFLQHSLFVSNDDVRGFELEQILESIVPVDDATVEIVQVGGRETSTFQWNERTQIRRDDRKHVENHPLRPRVR